MTAKETDNDYYTLKLRINTAVWAYAIILTGLVWGGLKGYINVYPDGHVKPQTKIVAYTPDEVRQKDEVEARMLRENPVAYAVGDEAR